MVEDGDARAERLHFLHVVAGVDRPSSRPRSSAAPARRCGCRDCGSTPVVGSSRNSSFGRVDEGRREVEPPLHAAGERAGPVVGAVGQADRRRARSSTRAVQVLAAEAVELAEEAEVLAGRQVGVDREVLRARCR